MIRWLCFGVYWTKHVNFPFSGFLFKATLHKSCWLFAQLVSSYLGQMNLVQTAKSIEAICFLFFCVNLATFYFPLFFFFILPLIHMDSSGVIEVLVNSGRQIDAVNLAFAFDLTEQFSPVTLLKSYLKEARKVSSSVKPGNASPITGQVRVLSLLD